MRERKSLLPIAVLLAYLTGGSLCGCSKQAELTKTDFQKGGGPMPASFAAGAAKRQAEAEKRMPASYKAWQEQRSAALGHGAAPANSTTR
jgi:hypothetical protein